MALAPLLRLGVRLINGFGRITGVDRLAGFEPEALVATARRRTGLHDLGTLPYPQGLERACRSLEDDARLTLTGRIALREHTVMALTTRLRLQERRVREPELFERPLRAPIIVLGLPRSGTTLLHRLLADLPGARGVPAWQIREPLRGPGTDHRVRDATLALAVMRALRPELDRKHHLAAAEAEECVGFFDPSLWTPTFWRLASVYGYLDWYLQQDPRAGYRVYRQLLQVVQAETPDARLVLKLPNHLGFVDALREVIPEAHLVQTHRDPVPVIASYCSLATSVHGAWSDTVRGAQTGEASLDLWGTLMDRCMRARAGPDDTVLDIDYGALTTDPVGQVRRVHAHAGIAFTPEIEGRVAASSQARPQHRFGRHTYALPDYGLEPDRVRARFEGYLTRHARGPDTLA